MNLQQDARESYDACPNCLTEIVLDDEPTVAIEEPEETGIEVEETAQLEKTVESPEASSECLHHLGYLSEKSSKEQIPEECMTCKDIVACMLKKMKE